MPVMDGEPQGERRRRRRLGDGRGLRFLSPHQVVMVDQALRSVGDYGEVRLVVSKGKLRFIVTQKSYDALKWEFGQSSET